MFFSKDLEKGSIIFKQVWKRVHVAFCNERPMDHVMEPPYPLPTHLVLHVQILLNVWKRAKNETKQGTEISITNLSSQL